MVSSIWILVYLTTSFPSSNCRSRECPLIFVVRRSMSCRRRRPRRRGTWEGGRKSSRPHPAVPSRRRRMTRSTSFWLPRPCRPRSRPARANSGEELDVQCKYDTVTGSWLYPKNSPNIETCPKQIPGRYLHIANLTIIPVTRQPISIVTKTKMVV